MAFVHRRAARVWRFPLGIVVLSSALGCFGCRKEAPAGAARQVASAAASVASPKLGRCRVLSPAKPFLVTTSEKPSPPRPEPDAGPDDEPDPLPFSVELGAARAFQSGFAVSGLRAEKGKTRAFVALVSGAGGRIIELGPVHGDPEPPLVLARGERLFVLVFDSDAAGRTVRFGEVVDPKGKATFRGAGELSGIGRDATGFSAELGGATGLLTFTAAARDKVSAFVVPFDPAERDAKLVAKALPLGAAAMVAEPRLAARGAGFWLAYVQELAQAKPVRKPPAADGGSDFEPEQLLDLGPSELWIVPLDASGAAAGGARSLTPPSNKPLLFDLVADADGGALVLWQESQGAPGADGGKIALVNVRPDGALDRRFVEDERLGAGIPVLLRDAEPPTPAAALWLIAPGSDDTTLFTALAPGKPLPFETDPLVRSAAILAAHRGRFLVSHPRGQNVELSSVECAPPSSAKAD